MKVNSMTLKLSTLTIACVAGLVGCGGGGGGSTPSAPSPATPAPGTGSTYVTSVPAATYSGEEASALSLLNSERQNCGFGLLAQNPALDKSSQAHADYMFANISASHNEVAGIQGFTGVTPQDRGAVAGYQGTVGEVSAIMNFGPGFGARAVRSWLATPYHGAGILGVYRDLGIALRSSGNASNLVASVNIDLGYVANQAGQQDMGIGEVRTYPCQGTVGSNPTFTSNEVPKPLPGRDLTARPVGAPLLVFSRQSTRVVISSASLLKVSTGASVPLLAPVTSTTDPNQYVPISFSYVFPDVPLEANTQYQATLTGSSNGTAFSRTFTFTTGVN